MKRIQSIEFLKLISIFFIVIIHSRYQSNFGIFMDAVARFSVPIFFMVTGYFIIQPNDMTAKLKKQILKLTRYYIFYELVYILFSFFISLAENNLQNFKYDFKDNMKYILISPAIGFHLWYVINIIWVLIIVYIFNHFNKLKPLFIFSIILHLIGIFISNLSIQLFHKVLPLCMTRNFLFFGLFYVLLGSYIRKADISKIKINKYIILAFSIFMCVCQVFEKQFWLKAFTSYFGDYFITTIFASSAMFIFALKCNVNNRIIQKLSSYSMPIYFLHLLMINILSFLSLKFLHRDIKIITSTIAGNTIFILVVCVLSCVFYSLCKKLFKPLLAMVNKTKISA